MENIVNMGSVKQLGSKLSSLNPFNQKPEESVSNTETAPPAVEAPGSDKADSTNATANDDKSSQSAISEAAAGASAIFSTAFNPVRNFGSKLGGLIAPGASGEVTKDSNEGNIEANSTDSPTATSQAEATAEKLKTFGSSLFSYGKQATSSVFKSTTGALESIKKTVEEKAPVIADFSKEQEKFLEEKRHAQAGPAVAPWVGTAGGSEGEEQLRIRIIELSADERNVLRPVPAGQSFEFDMQAHSSLAQLMLSLDSRLDGLRFKFVPKKITEENFWRNYFYRVSLLKQSANLMSSANSALENAAQKDGNIANVAIANNASPSTESPDGQSNPDFQEELERAVQQELNEYELVGGSGDDGVDESERNLEAEILAEIESK